MALVFFVVVIFAIVAVLALHPVVVRLESAGLYEEHHVVAPVVRVVLLVLLALLVLLVLLALLVLLGLVSFFFHIILPYSFFILLLSSFFSSALKHVALFEENSILPLPERLEASGVESVWGEISQESPENPEKSVKISLVRVGR